MVTSAFIKQTGGQRSQLQKQLWKLGEMTQGRKLPLGKGSKWGSLERNSMLPFEAHISGG